MNESKPAKDPDRQDAATAHDSHGKGSWYFVSRWFCVLCGHSTETRERRWDDRPENPADRSDYAEGACGVHFC